MNEDSRDRGSDGDEPAAAQRDSSAGEAHDDDRSWFARQWPRALLALSVLIAAVGLIGPGDGPAVAWLRAFAWGAAGGVAIAVFCSAKAPGTHDLGQLIKGLSAGSALFIV